MQVTDKIRAIASREWSNPDSEIYAACDHLDAKFAALVEAGGAAVEWFDVDETHDCEYMTNPEKGHCDFCWMLGGLRAALHAAKGNT